MPKRPRSAWFAAVLLTSGCASLDSLPNRPQSDVAAVVSEMMTCYLTEGYAPGYSIAIGRGDALLYSEGHGLADIENRVPMTPETRLRLGSVSKLFTAAAIATLSEQGEIDLDAPIRTYVPEFPAKRWPVTVRQIAAHMGGIRGYIAEDFAEGSKIDLTEYPTTSDALTIFADEPLKFEPGTAYKYSTFGFTLLTAAIENVTGQLYEDYLRSEVLAPLGIQSVFADRPERITENRASFYTFDDMHRLQNGPALRFDYKFGGGGLLATAEDLVRFGAAHTEPGLFNEATLTEDLFVENARSDGRSVNIGIAWRVGIDKKHGTVYHHSGSVPGGRSVLMVWPDRRMVVAAIANATNAPYDAEELAQTISEVAFAAFANLEMSVPLSIGELVFEDGSRGVFAAASAESCRGTMTTPPSIAARLASDGYPTKEVLPILAHYSAPDGGFVTILGSALGMHRIRWDTTGTQANLVELSNKFQWTMREFPIQLEPR